MKEFLLYVGVLAGIYAAQTCIKVATTRKDKTFDLKKLIDGIVDHVIRFTGIIIFFYAGSFISEKPIIPLGEKTLTIDDALTTFAYGLVVVQAIKLFANIRETYKVDDEVISKTLNETSKEIG